MRLVIKTFFRWLFVALLFSGCEKSPVTINLKIESGLERKDEVVTVSIEELKGTAPGFNSAACLIMDGENALPIQAIDSDGDGNPDKIVFVTDLAANEEKSLTIGYSKYGVRDSNFPRRTQAELSQKFGGKWESRKYLEGEFRNVDFVRVPDEHTDHSFFFRYEGPGWESYKVGYRFYLDWRNAIDIFGKKTPEMVLQNVGQDGFDSYHETAEWGMDILKVGER